MPQTTINHATIGRFTSSPATFRHPEYGYDFAKRIRLRTGVADIILSHHEKFDGIAIRVDSGEARFPWERAYSPWSMLWMPLCTTDRITADPHSRSPVKKF
jgi:hypothetical protein